MNKSHVIVGTCVLLLAGLVWLLWSDASILKQQSQISKTERKIKPQIESQADEDNSLLVVSEGVQKPEGMPQADWERALRVYATKKSANRNVSFYGKVVDQYGDPVEGVQLHLKILSYQDSFVDYFKTGREQIKNEFSMTTDANGIFSVEKQKGTSFSIEHMTKEGYVAPNRGTQYYFVYNNLSSGEGSSMYHTADKSRPVVYRMWKKGETEQLISTVAKLTIEPKKGINKMYYRMSLNDAPSPHPMPDWDIMVTGKNIHSPDPKRQQDDYWEVTLTAGDGGGLVLTDDPHANLAPEMGYQKSLTIKSTDQMNPWDRPVRRVYYRGKGGEEFAAFRLVLNFGTIKTGEWIEVTLADLRINPNGSRNLEFDKSRQIK
jgi:hypothetical protein